MEYGVNRTIIPNDIKEFIDVIIPKIERDLAINMGTKDEIFKLYSLYVDVLRLSAPYDFISFNKYLELDEDHNNPTKAFYHHRKVHMADVFDAFNDIEINDAYDMLLVMMPPRVGKSTTELRFVAWIMGKYPEETQLLTSYSDNITTSFYIGTMEIIGSERFNEIFTDAPLISQNAKREEIWLKVAKRYPTISFVPIGGSMTGRSEATRYLLCDDLVSGIEEALSVIRLDSLWQKYTVNAKQRKKDGCKEIHIATPWSVHDPITKVALENADNPRCKIIRKSCYNELGESNFDFKGGFSTGYYKDMQRTMDSASFSALYEQEAIEREGLLYLPDDLTYYFEMPSGVPDAIVAVVDSKNLGKDYVSAPVGYVYGQDIYIDDAVYNNGLPDVTKELVAKKLVEHNVTRADVEMNNGGNYFAEGVNELVTEKGGHTTFRLFFSSNNKNVKIITYSDFVKKRFLFRDKSTYPVNTEYAQFMRDIFKWTQTGKNPHDDSVDTLAMMAQLVQDLEGSSVKVLSRKELRL